MLTGYCVHGWHIDGAWCTRCSPIMAHVEPDLSGPLDLSKMSAADIDRAVDALLERDEWPCVHLLSALDASKG